MHTTSQGSRVCLRKLPAICTGVPLRPASKLKSKQSTHAAMITELDLLTRFAKVWRRLLEKDDSEASLLSWRGAPPDPSKLVRMRTLRGVRGVCATVPPKLPGRVAGATGRSST